MASVPDSGTTRHASPRDGSGFNLIDDPWIPLRQLDGRESLHSIRETLTDAHLLSGWFSGEPLFGAAAVRLLTAFMWRAIPGLRDAQPADLAAARETAAAAGRCPQAALDAYCDRYRDRFWLLEPAGAPVRRFGQDTRLGLFLQDHLESRVVKPVSVTKLSMHASPSYLWGNQLTGPLAPDAAARHLLMFLHYAPGGRPDGVHPDEENPRAGWQAARLRNTVSVHPCGRNLYETLLAHVAAPEEALVAGIGVPAWEHDSAIAVTVPLGPPRTLLEQITARFTHSVWLLSDADGNIDRAAVTTGRRRGSDVTELDPFIVRYWQRKGTGDDAEEFLRPLRAARGRSVWRDIDNLFVRAKSDEGDTRAYGDTPVVGSAPGWVAGWVLTVHRSVQSKEIAWSESSLPAAALLSVDDWRRCSAFVAETEASAAQLARQMKFFAGQAGLDAEPLRNKAMEQFWSAAERRFPAAMAAADVDALIEIPATDARHAFTAAASTVGARLCRGADSPDGAVPVATVAAICRSRILGPAARAERAARKARNTNTRADSAQPAAAGSANQETP